MDSYDKSFDSGAGGGLKYTAQDEKCKNFEDRDHNTSTDTGNNTFNTAEASLTNTNISVTSSNDLMVPGKLFADILKLKHCYLDILHEYDPCKNTDPKVDLLTKEQMLSGITKHKLKKDEIRDHLFSLLDNVRNICVPTYLEDNRPKRLPQECQINNLVHKVESLSSQNKCDFEALKQELDTLKSSISNFKSFIPQPPPNIKLPEPIPTTSDAAFAITHSEQHVAESIPGYIANERCNALFAAASSFPYKKENGRETVVFGESYNYNGSRNEPKQLPECINNIMVELNRKFMGNTAPLNSCLVNRYTGPTSYLPIHSDNERSIHPDSSIYTLSLGHECTVKFKDVLSSNAHQHQALPGSLYSMTRASQEFFKHSIDKNPSLSNTSVRISLTFRSVHWRNHNSTVILGDSNTGGLKFGTSGRTFRASMPGKRVPTFTIAELDATKCLGYNNIVVSCGLNDIRKKNIQTHEQVKAVYVDYKTKIENISSTNKRARIFVSPMLPTSLPDVNRKCRMFNRLIFDDLIQFNANISAIHGFDQYVDHVNGCLKEQFLKDDSLFIHLNDSGISLLAKLVKQSIFFRKQAGRNRQQVSNRSYANALQGGRAPPHPP